jgi:hypothetical protein
MHVSNRMLRPLLALLATHLLFSSYLLLAIESDRWFFWLIPPFELILAAWFLLSRGKTERSASPRNWGAAALFALLTYRLAGELFYRFFYLQNFSILNDSSLMVGFAGMLMGETALPPLLLGIAVWVLTIALLISIGKLLGLAFQKIAGESPLLPGLGWTLPILAASLASAFLIPTLSPVGSLAADVMEQASLRRAANAAMALADQSPPASPAAASDQEQEDYVFPIIRDQDVHFFVIESYGATLYMRDEYLEAIQSTYGELEPRLRSRGWDIYTGFVRSPAFGGRSWLADSSLLTGTFLANQAIFEAEISDGLPAQMLTFMADAGYHRIYAAPGTNGATDEWKIAYPFEEYLERYNYGYQGPFLNLGAMSDQYVLDRVGRFHIEEERRDFAMYILVSSHVPFTIIPQYKPDWDFSRFGREYEDGYLSYFDNNWLSGNELAEGYLAGIDYSLRSIEGYIETHLDDQGFILIIGDHQPRKPVSVPTAGYAVPFHILTRRGTPLQFPAEWTLSRTLMPPPLPPDESVLGTIADIPGLVQELLLTPPEAAQFIR